MSEIHLLKETTVFVPLHTPFVTYTVHQMLLKMQLIVTVYITVDSNNFLYTAWSEWISRSENGLCMQKDEVFCEEDAI